MVIRLEPIIMELERSEDILIVTHQAVLRCIYAYFMKKTQEESPWMAVPLHKLIKLTPRAYGTEEEFYDAEIPAVSTWRAKGSVAKHDDPVEGTLRLGSHEAAKVAIEKAIADGSSAKFSIDSIATTIVNDENAKVGDGEAAKIGNGEGTKLANGDAKEGKGASA